MGFLFWSGVLYAIIAINVNYYSHNVFFYVNKCENAHKNICKKTFFDEVFYFFFLMTYSSISRCDFGIGYMNLSGNKVNVFKIAFVSFVKTLGTAAFVASLLLAAYNAVSSLCVAVFAVLLLINIICVIAGKNRRSLVNLLTGTICVDLR